MGDYEPRQCPFLKQECIQERCELWGTVPIVRPGKLAGSSSVYKISGCALNLLVALESQPTAVQVVPGKSHGN